MRHSYIYILLILLLLPVVSASITSVTTPILPGTYGEDSQIPIVIDYNTNVNVVGSPVLETSNGDAQYASNSGGKVTFLYTVAASDSGYVDVISFDTSNGNISDDSSEFPEYELGIVLDGDVDSRSTITINTPSVVDKSSVWTNVSFSGPNSAKTVTTLTANSTQTNVCVNCAITLTDGTYTLSVTTTNVVNLTSTASKQFKVDANAPKITSVKVLLPAETVMTQNQTIDASQLQINLSIVATDTVNIELNDATATNQLQLQAGLNKVVIKATDDVHTTTFTFYVRVMQPFNVANLASLLASKGVTLVAEVNGLDVTGHQSLMSKYLNATLAINNVTYALTNVYVPGISSNAVSSISVQTSDSSFTNNAEVNVLYWYRYIANIKSVFTQYASLRVSASFPYTQTNVSLLSFDASTIVRPTLNVQTKIASFNATGFGVAVAEDAIAPKIVKVATKSATDVTAIIGVTTNEPSTCRISARAGTYANISQYVEFAVPQENVESQVSISSLIISTGYTYYVSCVDKYNNAMTTSSAIAFTTSGTPSPVTPATPTTLTPDTSTSMSRADKDLISSLGKNNQDYVRINQVSTKVEKASSLVDLAALNEYTSQITGEFVETKIRTTATSYELIKQSGASETLTKVTTRITFDSTVPDRFNVIFAIPKSIAKSDKKLSGSFDVIEKDPVISFSKRARDVSDGEISLSYIIVGDKTDAADEVLTFVQKTSSTSSAVTNKPTATTTTPPQLNSNLTPTMPGNVVQEMTKNSSAKKWMWIVLSIIAIIFLIWLIGKGMSQGGQKKGGYVSSGALYRENFVHRNN